MKLKEAQIAKNNPDKDWGTLISKFQNLLQGTLIKTAQYWHKYRHIDQWRIIGNLQKINTPLVNDVKTIQLGKNRLFNKWYWEN